MLTIHTNNEHELRFLFNLCFRYHRIQLVIFLDTHTRPTPVHAPPGTAPAMWPPNRWYSAAGHKQSSECPHKDWAALTGSPAF